jgi:hypothetical protein
LLANVAAALIGTPGWSENDLVRIEAVDHRVQDGRLFTGRELNLAIRGNAGLALQLVRQWETGGCVVRQEVSGP